MGVYERRLLPRLVDLAMRNKEATRYRTKTVPAAAGRVLEIGIGSGLNLPFYSSEVTHLYGLDPSPELLALAQRKRFDGPFPVEFVLGSAEGIPLERRSIDVVVSTFVLCTVPDATKALREAARVLRPGGTLLFAEHGQAPDAKVVSWQRRLDPLWSRIAGGCHLTREIDRLILEAGFRMAGLERNYAKGPRPFSYMYCGRASPV